MSSKSPRFPDMAANSGLVDMLALAVVTLRHDVTTGGNVSGNQSSSRQGGQLADALKRDQHQIWPFGCLWFSLSQHDASVLKLSYHAYIGAPPMLGVALIFAVIYLPAVAISWFMASGLTTGMLLGYMGYQVVHHATHFWHASRGSYLYRARLHHSAHHYHGKLGNFGITTAFWDQVFSTAVEVRRPGRKDTPGSQRSTP
jgi:hypothetical protein